MDVGWCRPDDDKPSNREVGLFQPVDSLVCLGGNTGPVRIAMCPIVLPEMVSDHCQARVALWAPRQELSGYICRPALAAQIVVISFAPALKMRLQPLRGNRILGEPAY
jgi:hypothetical protein